MEIPRVRRIACVSCIRRRQLDSEGKLTKGATSCGQRGHLGSFQSLRPYKFASGTSTEPTPPRMPFPAATQPFRCRAHRGVEQGSEYITSGPRTNPPRTLPRSAHDVVRDKAPTYPGQLLQTGRPRDLRRTGGFSTFGFQAERPEPQREARQPARRCLARAAHGGRCYLRRNARPCRVYRDDPEGRTRRTRPRCLRESPAAHRGRPRRTQSRDHAQVGPACDAVLPCCHVLDCCRRARCTYLVLS